MQVFFLVDVNPGGFSYQAGQSYEMDAAIARQFISQGVATISANRDGAAPYRRAVLTEYYTNDEDGPPFYRARWVDRTVTKYTADGLGNGEVEAYNLATDPLELSSVTPSAADLAELQQLIDLY